MVVRWALRPLVAGRWHRLDRKPDAERRLLLPSAPLGRLATTLNKNSSSKTFRNIWNRCPSPSIHPSILWFKTTFPVSKTNTPSRNQAPCWLPRTAQLNDCCRIPNTDWPTATQLKWGTKVLRWPFAVYCWIDTKTNGKWKKGNRTTLAFCISPSKCHFVCFWNVLPGDAYLISRQSLVLSQSRCVRGMLQVHKVKIHNTWVVRRRRSL